MESSSVAIEWEVAYTSTAMQAINTDEPSGSRKHKQSLIGLSIAKPMLH